MNCYYRRLPLTGSATNVRDLGGYAAADGKAVRFGRFLRADNPAGLDERDVELLLDYGVRTILDIRDENEIARNPHALYGRKDIVSLHIPMLNVDKINLNMDQNQYTLGQLYIYMMDHARNWLRDVLRAIAKSQPCVMFNCTAGKDRTGMLSAVLLSIAGVCREDIVADYALTRVYLEKELKRFAQLYPIFGDAPPSAMQYFLDTFNAERGGVVNAVRDMGVSEEELSAVRAMMLD